MHKKVCSFIGWLSFHLKSAFRAAMGYQMAAIHRAKSLDAPLQDDDDGTLYDMIQDPIDQYEETEMRIWLERLRGELNKALATLPDEEANTIRHRYFPGKTLKQIRELDGISPNVARQRESFGLRKLRNRKISKELQQFIEDRTPYYKKVSVERFKRTRCSSVEEIVLIRLNFN